MVDVSAYRFPDPLAGVQRGYEFGNALRQDTARQAAGNALRDGNFKAASGALYGEGMLDEGAKVRKQGQAERDEALKFIGDAAGRLSDLHNSTGDVNQTLAAFDQLAPRFQQYGETAEELADIRAKLQANPSATLVSLGAGSAKQLGYEVQGSGDEVLVIDKKTGKLVNRYRGARTTNVAEGGSLVEIPGQYGTATPAQTSMNSLAQPPAAPAAAAVNPDATWSAMIQRESGGNGNAVGPQTPYGRAQGSTQMLMETAEAMARKIGVPWRPDLMRGDTPRALAYQEKLGRAYYDEGLQKYGGDPHKAAMYYHGGPNEGLWGPKTHAYADAVAGGAEPYEVASNGETPAPPGARVLLSRPKPADPLKALQEQKLRGEIAEQEQKRSAAAEKAELSQRGLSDKAEIVGGAVDNALSHVGRLTSGFIGGNLADIKGTPAYNLAREIETIKANLSFDELQKMRAASPTGGALGAVSDREIQLLGSTVASLDIGQGPEQLRANLNTIKAHYAKWKAASTAGGSVANPAVARAREAIAKGAPRDKVIERLRSAGVDPSGL